MARLTLVTAAAVALSAAWWHGRSSADEVEATKPWPATSVALIDLAKVFAESPRLTRLREGLAAEFAAESGDVKAIQEELQALVKRAEAAKEKQDAKAFKELHEEFEKKTAALKAEAQKLQALFAPREVELLRSFYGDVQAEVEQVAQERGIALVLRTQSDIELPSEITEVKQAQKAAAQMNRLVIYENSLDITGDVIDRMRVAGTL